MLGFAFLMTLGLTAQYVQSQPRSLPADVYEAQDRLFKEATMRGQTGHALAVNATDLPSPDSLVAPPHQRGQGTPSGSVTQETLARDVATSETSIDAAEKVAAADTQPPRMNLNTATASQLERLPRIGPTMAGRIIAYRTTHGPFQRVEELINVKGIGEKTLAQLLPLLFVETQA